jgi:hypothetical protein
VYAYGVIKKNRPFKNNFTWQYGESNIMAQHSLTPTWRLKQEALSEVCQWVLQALTTYSSRC